MHIPTILRKSAYVCNGSIMLSDRVRNFAYAWAWSWIQSLDRSSSIVDIGSRDSLFPAFLAWRGYCVTVVEKDQRFADTSARISRRWNVGYAIQTEDFASSGFEPGFNAILSLFSLQHAGENDIPAYRKASELLALGGMFLSVCEYDGRETVWQTDRDDGPLRIYGPRDIEERIEKTLMEGGLEIVEKRFATWNKGGKRLHWDKTGEAAQFCFLIGKKRLFKRLCIQKSKM